VAPSRNAVNTVSSVIRVPRTRMTPSSSCTRGPALSPLRPWLQPTAARPIGGREVVRSAQRNPLITTSARRACVSPVPWRRRIWKWSRSGHLPEQLLERVQRRTDRLWCRSRGAIPWVWRVDRGSSPPSSRFGPRTTLSSGSSASVPRERHMPHVQHVEKHRWPRHRAVELLPASSSCTRLRSRRLQVDSVCRQRLLDSACWIGESGTKRPDFPHLRVIRRFQDASVQQASAMDRHDRSGCSCCDLNSFRIAVGELTFGPVLFEISECEWRLVVTPPHGHLPTE
jgi:hypothetical protein